jgi:hypothetical protein
MKDPEARIWSADEVDELLLLWCRADDGLARELLEWRASSDLSTAPGQTESSRSEVSAHEPLPTPS